MNSLIQALRKDFVQIDALADNCGLPADFVLHTKSLTSWPCLPKISPEEGEYHAQLGAAIQSLSDNSALSRLYTVLAKCESPIERVFIVTFWLTTLAYVPDLGAPQPDLGAEYERISNTPDPTLLVAPQAQISDMRVDFALTHYGMWPNFDVREIFKGHEIPGSSFSRVRAVVECDGHEFHEKTKAQASRDKARDRALVSQGFRVFRLSGSEIWNHPGAMAYEVAKAMYDLAWDAATPSLG
ncbi:MAG: DUF559 domain-containing protein [Dehalogenimonas sp.]|uniref:DUF559 domain-containing protein n=1 Tax=Candidatus Dehalogenimonas loeffleri TaxID=3127115 RepID=A0ABZ2J762_9CHLR|nr:DUF559 domain-containing protein [Dehalogenimonas sp.]